MSRKRCSIDQPHWSSSGSETGCESTTHGVLAHDPWNNELSQIVPSTGLGSDPRHAESAKGLTADQGACAVSVDVQVSDSELPTGTLNVGGHPTEDATGQLVLGLVGDLDRFVQILDLDHGKNRSEDLFGCQAMLCSDSRKEVGADIGFTDSCFKTIWNRQGDGQFTLGLADLDVGTDLVGSFLVDDGADVRSGIHRIIDRQRSDGLDESTGEGLRGGFHHDDSAAGGAFLSLESKGTLADSQHRFVQIGRGIDDDRVLATHLTDHPLHEWLVSQVCVLLPIDDVQSDSLGTGEGDDRGTRIPYQMSADNFSVLQEGSAERSSGIPALVKDVDQNLGDSRESVQLASE